MAAKGMCVLREIGVRIDATTTHATRAPVTALKPNWVSAAQRKAWANMPTATGHGNMRSGVEKKRLYAATATPAAMTSCDNGTAGRMFWPPNIPANATAPAAAASAKRPVGIGGNREIS